LKETDLFRAASITKTFTSAAMMVLVEQGKVDLDLPIDIYLLPETIGVLEAGGYAPDVITVRQLLGHTAGIYDYTEAEAYYAAIRENPSRVWTRAEQVAVAMDEGEPLNLPGAEFHYGDTHYVLAGEILEEVTGLGLAEALRELLRYEAIGLTDTWLETLESPPAGAEARISHPYIGLEDTRAWHASWDLSGGGGLVTSTADIVRFFSALFEGRVFAKLETLEAWLEVPPEGEGAFFGMDGGMGCGRFELDGGGTCYAGFGFFSTVMVICPDKNFVFVGTANQADPAEPDALFDGVLEVLLAE
jgi:D-alanyl-D-alanine carboxypeptidase